MRKITLLLTLAMAIVGGVKSWAQTFPDASTADNPKWYTLASYNRGGYLTDQGSGNALQHVALSLGAIWRFETGDATGALKMYSANDNALSEKWTTGAKAMDVWVLANGVNTSGVTISAQNNVNGNCLDANSHDANVGTWNPRSNDWQGTTWVVAEIREALQARVEYAQSLAGTAVGYKNVDATALTNATAACEKADMTPQEFFGAYNALETAIANAPTVTPEAGKYYYIRHAYDQFFVKQGVYKAMYAEGANNKWKTWDAYDLNFIWAWNPKSSGTGYGVQNIGTDKWLNTVSNMADTEPEGNITLVWLALGQWNIKATGGGVMHANTHSSGAGVSGTIIDWAGGANTASAWSIIECDINEVSDHWIAEANALTYGTGLGDCATSSQAAVQTATQALTNDKSNTKYIKDLISAIDAAKASRTQDLSVVVTLAGTSVTKTLAISGAVSTEDLQAKIEAQLFAEVGKGYYTLSIAQADGAYTATVTTGTLPFTVSTTDAPYWQALSLKPANHFYLYSEGEGDVKTNVTTFNTAGDEYLWAFTGNVLEGFVLYNKAAGITKPLASPDPTGAANEGGSTYPKVNGNDATKWAVYSSTYATNGFYLGYETTGKKLNQRGADLAYWTAGADGGSTFVVSEIWDAFKAHNTVAPTATIDAIAALDGTDIVYCTAACVANAKTAKTALDAAAAFTWQGQVAQVQSVTSFAVEYETPAPNAFYRIKGGTSGNYMTSDVADSKPKIESLTADNELKTIWYLDANNKLVSYAVGQGIKDTHTLANVGDNINVFTFQAAAAGAPYLALKSDFSGSQYICDWTSGNADRFGSDTKANRTHWVVERVESIPVKIAASGYSSLYLPVATDIPSGVEAWTATGVNADGVITLLRISDGILPADCAVILKGDAGTYYFDVTTSAGTATSIFSGNAIKTARNGAKTYVLGNVDGVVDIYNYTAANIPAFKMYYQPTTSGNVRIQFGEEIATAIDAARNNEMQEGVMYNLGGVQVQKAQGIVIVNGKKFAVK